MAARRSRNRRFSSSRRSSFGILADNTDIVDNDDPLWYNKSIIRPSTSFTMAKDATSVLNGDSTVNVSQMSDNWFENLTQSENSKIIQGTVKKNISNRLTNEQNNAKFVEPSTESESEHESQKKRAKFKLSQKSKNNKTVDKSNAFLKALEKTTDSHTRNITNVHTSDVNDSESNTDDSRTIKKLRPRFVGNKKPSKEITNNFDDVLYSDSASERIGTNSSMKRRSTINNTTSYTPEKIRKVAEHNSDIHSNAHYSVNKTKDNITTSITEILKNKSANKTLIETSRKSLRNRTIDNTAMNPPELNLSNESANTTVTNSAKKESSTKSKSETPSKARTSTRLSQRKYTNRNIESDESMNRSSNSIVSELRKQRPLLLSQKNKSKTDENLFDSALESGNHSKNKSTTHTSTRISERNGLGRNNEDEVHKNDFQANASDSESSSIPKNIRRTRSHSMFNQNKSEDESEEINGIQNETGTEKIQNKEETSKLQTIPTKNHENTLNISKTEKEKSKSIIINEKSQRHSKRQTLGLTINNSKNISKLSNKSARNKTNNSLEVVKSVNGENIVNNSEESIEMENLESSKTESRENLNKSNTAPLSKRSKTSGIENGYDEVPFNENSVNEISKNKTIEKSLKASRKSRVSKMLNNSKSSSKPTNHHSLNGSSNIKSTIWEKSHHSQQDENEEGDSRNSNEENEDEGESSSIPKHIRRTRSRLFQKSEYEEENENDPNEILDVVNTSSPEKRRRTNVSLARKSANQNLSTRNGDPSGTEENHKIVGLKITRIETISGKLFEPTEKSMQSNAGNVSLDKGKTVKSLGNKSKTARSSVNKSESLRSSVNTTDETNKSFNNPKIPIVETDNGSIKSVETSSDGSAAVGSTEIKPATPPRQNLIHNTSGQFSDDLLHTPNPAQSTLIMNGKPVTRITQFSFRNNSIIDEEAAASTSTSQSRSVSPPSLPPSKEDVRKKNVASLKPLQEEEEDFQIDVMNNSDDTSQEHLISRRPEDIPPESEAEHSRLTKKSTAVSENSTRKDGSKVKISSTKKDGSQMKKISVRVERSVMTDGSIRKDESSLKETSMGNDEPALKQTSIMNKSALNKTSMMNKSAMNDSLTRKGKSAVKNSSVKMDKPAGNDNATRKDKSSVKNSSVQKEKPAIKEIYKKKLKSTQKNNLLSYFGTKSQSSEGSLDPSTMSEEDWAKLKKKTDAMKKKIEKRMDEEERLKQEEAQKKARLDAQLKRVLAQQEAERRRKQKKPIDPAFYVNGAVYKPPKLPRPKSWATDRLYRYLWKCLEPHYGHRARVKSEQFVLKLADLAGKIEKRNKYVNYSAELDEVHRIMAKLNIIKTRYDFHRFCSDYMPYSFRIKAVPMMLPGNVRNIPYDPDLVNKPILEELNEDEENSASNDSDSE